tara:strand:- start:1285 stop:1581 length:297 start_codon:yes stop_codon:yes gene_type:complete
MTLLIMLELMGSLAHAAGDPLPTGEGVLGGLGALLGGLALLGSQLVSTRTAERLATLEARIQSLEGDISGLSSLQSDQRVLSTKLDFVIQALERPGDS